MANNGVNFDMSGLDELEKALKDLELVESKKVLRRAVREGAKPVLNDIKSGMKSRWGDNSGALQDSVKLSVSAPKNKKWADVIASIGVFRIRSLEAMAGAWYKKGYVGATNLAYWFEYGVQPHSLGKKSRAGSDERRERDTGGGQHPGIPARPVIRPAMDNNLEIVMHRTQAVLASEIDRVIRKRGRNS